jgi:hypothetical protein
MTNLPGLARTALTVPAIEPANAISERDSCGNGEIRRFDIPYDAKSNELTPAMPMRGLAIPCREISRIRH